MASRILNPNLFHLRLPLFAATVGATSLVLLPQLHSRYAIRLDSSPANVSPKDWSFSQYQQDARTPVISQGGRLNARAVRQMSAGSIIGTLYSFCFLQQTLCKHYVPNQHSTINQAYNKQTTTNSIIFRAGCWFRHLHLQQTPRPPHRPPHRGRADSRILLGYKSSTVQVFAEICEWG